MPSRPRNPREYIAPVEKGIREAAQTGVANGHPVLNTTVTLYDGTYHEVDSSEMSVHLAGSIGCQRSSSEG